MSFKILKKKDTNYFSFFEYIILFKKPSFMYSVFVHFEKEQYEIDVVENEEIGTYIEKYNAFQEIEEFDKILLERILLEKLYTMIKIDIYKGEKSKHEFDFNQLYEISLGILRRMKVLKNENI